MEDTKMYSLTITDRKLESCYYSALLCPILAKLWVRVGISILLE